MGDIENLKIGYFCDIVKTDVGVDLRSSLSVTDANGVAKEFSKKIRFGKDEENLSDLVIKFFSTMSISMAERTFRCIANIPIDSVALKEVIIPRLDKNMCWKKGEENGK